jgi:murein DD-endopeptidase MepM/ murein hydrolase activator NlpD
MRLRPLSFIVLTCLFIALLAPAGAETRYHTVKKGESLWSIARDYGITRDELYAANGLNAQSQITPGKKLVIPGEDSSAAQVGPTELYTVRSGDTLYRIALEHGTNEPRLRALNQFPEKYVLKAGSRIKVPAAKGAHGAVADSGDKGAPNGTQDSQTKQTSPSPGNSATQASQGLSWPIKGCVSYMDGKLYGVEISGSSEKSVKAIRSGRVVHAGPYRGYGLVVFVEAKDSLVYGYLGIDSLLVKKGELVQAGTALGDLKSDPKSNKNQMYFTVLKNGRAIDPASAPRDAFDL